MSTIDISTKPEFMSVVKLFNSHLGSTREELLLAAKFLHAYTECSDAIQAGIRDMIGIVVNEATDADDRAMTLATLADALFPHLHEGKLGLDLEQAEQMGSQASEEMRTAVEELDREEAAFADRLSEAMKERSMNQVQLAEVSGVGQPAISNMLKRRCRPQRRTIIRFADALKVSPEDLWPGFSSQ
ncbi:MAG: helix-turn-helix transcriptional regulator [Planctomycetia bacterium]|nr:helix-turn-helix transcriptional regulator [Planctomycetia bacterium]